MEKEGIQCGIHYAAFHKSPLINNHQKLEQSEREEYQTVSLPFHEGLNSKNIEQIINNIRRNQND